MKDIRAEGLAVWARATEPGLNVPGEAVLEPVSDDASFRRYFRFSEGGAGLVLVDAPPAHEDNESFIKISAALCDAGLQCPRVLAADLDLGYMAVTDLGNQLYLAEILQHPDRRNGLYQQAVDAIMTLIPLSLELPAYDADRLYTEMSLFHEWFLEKQLKLTVTPQCGEMLEQVYRYLVEKALEQPVGFVHRDFHSRNLMVVDNGGPGIIDFQDAVSGPVTYDLVSLYKDCYYRFERSTVTEAVQGFHRRLMSAEIVTQQAPVLEWFDLMGAQRHLKCAGIFSRLNLRDGKPGYLADIPLVIDYLVEASALYPALHEFHGWLSAVIVPLMDGPDFLLSNDSRIGDLE